MVRLAFLLVALLALTLVVGLVFGQDLVRPPITEKQIVVDTLHGVVIEDPYRWLEDQQSPQTRAWLETQAEYTNSFISQFPSLAKIEGRLGQLMRTDEVSQPFERGGKYFLMKKGADEELWSLCVREGLSGEDRVLVDPQSLSPDHSVSVSFMDVSIDGKLMAYSVQKGGEDESTVYFMELEKETLLNDVLKRGVYFGLSISADNSGFYYSVADSLAKGVYYHQFGTAFSADTLLFGNQYGPEELIGADLSQDGKYLDLTVYYGSGATKTEMYFIDVAKGGPVTPVVTGIDAVFEGSIVKDRIYIRTNYQAPNWCVYAAELAKPQMENWKLVIPERKDAVIEAFTYVGGRMFVSYLEDVNSKIKIFTADGEYIRDLDLPAMGSTYGVYGKWDDREGFYTFSSFHIPNTVYRLNLDTYVSEVWHRSGVAIASDNYDVKQVWYYSKDSTRVPMFLVHRKDIVLDGTNHTYMTGYGGFNASWTPGFSCTYAYWVETGGVVAVPNLRGGGEFGEEWHRAGMLENKQNTFDDFIAAAEWLIENKYTSPNKLAIEGGSNGGLLVGAVMNQRPDLFKAVVCTYPLLDMLRFHKFLMGPYWVSEYGSADNPEQFEYIYKYSPYHNVTMGANYPAVLFVSGDSDTRVAPLHIRKMTALLQEATGSPNPILLYYDTQSGHSGGAPMSKTIRDKAVQLGFLFWQLGVEP